MQGSEGPFPLHAITSRIRLRQRRSWSVISSRSRSRTTSQPGSRSGSLPPDFLPSTSRLDTTLVTSNPLKRERSESVDVDRAGPSVSRIQDDDGAPPSLKRMRLQTDSIDDVSNMLTIDTAYSSFDAGPPSTAGASGSQGHEGGALQGADSSQSLDANAIDVDALHEGAPGTTPSTDPVADAPANSEGADVPSHAPSNAKSLSEPLSSYTCPICFSPPVYATLTPCGHICCGECLFTAVKATIERSQFHGPASQNAKCPVCRALIPGWDGQGGGVIGLKPRFMYKNAGGKS